MRPACSHPPAAPAPSVREFGTFFRIRLVPSAQPLRCGPKVLMDDLIPVSLQRPVVGAMPAAPATLTALWTAHEAGPIQLLRTREGRSLSRARYRRAQE